MEGNYCYRYPHPAVTTDCVVFGYDGLFLSPDPIVQAPDNTQNFNRS